MTEIADPGKNFVIYYALFAEEALHDLLKRYEKRGGRTWPRMLEHIREQWAAYPAIVAQFVLITGEESTMEAHKRKDKGHPARRFGEIMRML